MDALRHAHIDEFHQKKGTNLLKIAMRSDLHSMQRFALHKKRIEKRVHLQRCATAIARAQWFASTFRAMRSECTELRSMARKRSIELYAK